MTNTHDALTNILYIADAVEWFQKKTIFGHFAFCHSEKSLPREIFVTGLT